MRKLAKSEIGKFKRDPNTLDRGRTKEERNEQRQYFRELCLRTQEETDETGFAGDVFVDPYEYRKMCEAHGIGYYDE